MVEWVGVRCVDCGTYQCIQHPALKGKKIPVRKWTCRLCNKKQSVVTIHAISHTAADVRKVIQRLNQQRQEIHDAQERQVLEMIQNDEEEQGEQEDEKKGEHEQEDGEDEVRPEEEEEDTPPTHSASRIHKRRSRSSSRSPVLPWERHQRQRAERDEPVTAQPPLHTVLKWKTYCPSTYPEHYILTEAELDDILKQTEGSLRT